MTRSLLIVDRPGEFRDALARVSSARGVTVQTRDDAMDTLGSLDALGAFAPSIVLVAEDPGAPGAGSLCRILRRRLGSASVVRLGDPAERDPLDAESVRLPRALGVEAVVRSLFEPAAGLSAATQLTTAARAFDIALGPRELPALLVTIAEHWLEGRLVLSTADTERELRFVRGMPVFASSSRLSERLGTIAVQRELITQAELDLALDFARSSQRQLGAALLARDALSGAGLFRALGAQLVMQLTAACDEGACRARFVMEAAPRAGGLVLRAQPMTLVFAACRARASTDVATALEACASTELGALPRSVERFVRDLGVTEPIAQTFGALRDQLRSTLGHDDDADAATLAVSRALSRSTALQTLVLPSAIAPAQSEHARSLDAYLHGARTNAREHALHGSSADVTDAHAELLALYARATGAGAQALFSAAERSSAAGLLVAALELRKRVDGLASQLGDALCAYAASVIREHIAQALAVVSLPDAEQPAAAAAPAPAPHAPGATRLSQHTAAKPPPPPPPPVRASLSLPPAKPQAPASLAPPRASVLAALPEIEPLVEQGKWQELRLLVAARYPDPTQLSSLLALLYAIALKEDAPAEESPKRIDADALGIRAMGELLGVAEQSPTALVVAKRILRRRPLEWNQKPPRRISFMIVMIALLIGASVGFFISPTLFK